jgi:hypothetical protein
MHVDQYNVQGELGEDGNESAVTGRKFFDQLN